MWRHGAVLAVVLVGFWTIVGDDGVFFPDEGAVLAQATELAEGGDWGITYPQSGVDPAGRHVPFPGSNLVADGEYAPFVGHPLIPWIGSKVVGAGGGASHLVVLGSLATAVAAVAAGRLAERMRPRAGTLAVWLTGLGSPLFVQSAIVTWHSVGAAAVAWSAVAVDAAARPKALGSSGSPPRWVPWVPVLALGAAVLIGVGVLVRTEVILAAVGLGVGAIVVAFAQRRWSIVLVGAAGVVGAAAAALLESRWFDAVVADARAVGFGGRSVDEPRDVLDGLRSTVLWTDYGGYGQHGQLLAIGTALVVAAAVAHRRRLDRRVVDALAVVGGTFLALRVVSSAGTIASLVYSQPAVVVGAIGIRRAHGGPTRRLVVVATAVGALGVVASQYGDGGGFQWGGRFFAVLLPLAAALSATGWASFAEDVERGRRRFVLGALVVLVGLAAVAGGRAVDDAHRRNARVVDGELAAAMVDERIDAVVSLDLTMGRRAWPHTVDGRWVSLSRTASEAVVDELLEGLRRSGVEHVIVLTNSPEALDGIEGHLDEITEVGSTTVAGPVPLLVYSAVLSARPPPG